MDEAMFVKAPSINSLLRKSRGAGITDGVDPWLDSAPTDADSLGFVRTDSSANGVSGSKKSSPGAANLLVDDTGDHVFNAAESTAVDFTITRAHGGCDRGGDVRRHRWS